LKGEYAFGDSTTFTAMRQIPKGMDCKVSIWLIFTTGSQAAAKVPGRFRMGPLSSLNLGYFELKIITIFDQRV
jgi:hypothetical protein